MRAYHLLPERYGLENLAKRRLKVSRLSDLNDPFELIPVSLPTRQHRTALTRLKSELDEFLGVLCFSMSWSNPVLWSHYGDKHRGMCLGFDVPDHLLLRIKYREQRAPLNISKVLGGHADPMRAAKTLLTTKYAHWRYEREVRLSVRLRESDPESGLFFVNFNRHIRLREVVVGAESALGRPDIERHLTGHERNVELKKARLAFKSFRVVTQMNQSLW